MTKIAIRLREGYGFTLRSGHASGADRAFEIGAQTDSEIFLPWPSFGQKPYNDDPGMPVLGRKIAAPEAELITNYAWLIENGFRDNQSPTRSVQLLHGRNCYQILGSTMNDPVKFAVCWTPDGAETEAECSGQTGGTGTAIRLADRYAIPVFNLKRPDALARMAALLAKYKDLRADNQPSGASNADLPKRSQPAAQ